MKSWENAFAKIGSKDEYKLGEAGRRRVLTGGCVLITLPQKRVIKDRGKRD